MWSTIPYHIDPVFFELGPFSIRYYGLFYFIALGFCYAMSIYRIKKEQFRLTVPQFELFFQYAVLGGLIGARIGYFLFYHISTFYTNPLSIILPFHFGETISFTGFSGMSYHGGLIGSITGALLFSTKYKVSLLNLADLVVPSFPLGYAFGRLGNFFNSELYGKPTSMPIGMYFPTDPHKTLRHPSQLYEAFGEGILIFLILWPLRNTRFFKHTFLFMYLMLYGTVRFIIEFFREPDEHIGTTVIGLSRGQLFCLAMIITGASLFIYNKILKNNVDDTSQ